MHVWRTPAGRPKEKASERVTDPKKTEVLTPKGYIIAAADVHGMIMYLKASRLLTAHASKAAPCIFACFSDAALEILWANQNCSAEGRPILYGNALIWWNLVLQHPDPHVGPHTMLDHIKNFNDFVGSKYEHVALALTLQATVAERAYKGASKKTKESTTLMAHSLPQPYGHT